MNRMVKVNVTQSTMLWCGDFIEVGEQYVTPYEANILRKLGALEEHEFDFHRDAPEWYRNTLTAIWNGRGHQLLGDKK